MFVRLDNSGISFHTTYNGFCGKGAVNKADPETWVRIMREAAQVEEKMARLLGVGATIKVR